MTRQVTRVFDPDSGGRPIPDAVKLRTEARIRTFLERKFAGRFTRVDIRLRRQFCYVDAYTEPVMTPGWPLADWLETREEYDERLRSIPVHLCRLRYLGDEERWGFASSSETYKLSVFPSGEFLGPPEDAALVSANAYL